MCTSIRQVKAIFIKNLKRNMSNKKKLLSQFIFPIIICIMYHFYQSQQGEINPLKIILKFMLTIYIGIINSSTIREIITLFINQRQEGSRQYQYVMGLCKKVHTLSNMFYMMVLSSVFLLPFYILLNIYQFNIIYVFNFAAFIVSSSFLTIALTSFFTDHKVATEIIGFIFSLGSFLPFFYDANSNNLKHYLAIFMPNSAFSIAIMSNDDSERFTVSLSSLFLWKFYLLIFYAVQFRQDFIQSLKNIKNKCTQWSRRNQPEQQILMNQQIQASSVLSTQYLQDDKMRPIKNTIQMKNVIKKFGKVLAVNNVTLALQKSKILGLLGRNGAGKTTIVDMITKVTTPSSGKINFNHPQNGQLKVGICYQHEILYQDLTVIDHLRFYSELKGLDNAQDQITKIVDKVGIRDQLQKKTKELSGGNKRKLSFSIALLKSPQVLIFDQPTSGLDPLSRRNIWQILQSLRSSQTTIVLTTHHLDQADHLSDKISIIKKGRIIQQGTPKQIKQRYGKGYYLTIYQNLNDQSNIPFDIKLYTKIVDECLRQVKISQKNNQFIKYFITKSNTYSQIIKCIKTLQRLDGISISLQTNSLQQSFIALNMDQQSIQQFRQQPEQAVNQVSQAQLQVQAQFSNLNQIWGIVVKNFFCFIGKFHYAYNMNIIIIVFVTLINRLLISKLAENVEIDQKSKQEQTKINPWFIIQGYILMSSAFLSIPVLQKQEKIIQLLRTRGVRRINYWVGQFLFDFCYFWFNYLVMLGLFWQIISDIPLWIIACTAASMIFYSYTVSMIFNKLKTANNWFTIINSLLLLVMMPLMLPDSVIQTSKLRYLRFLKYVSPYYDLTYYLMSKSDLFSAVQVMNPTDKQQVIYTVHICLALYIGLFFVLQSSIIQKLIRKQEDQQIFDQVRLQNISKKYNNNVQALKNVSYKINDERLALLGHNGAGKSTTFGLLSSQLNPTQGKLYLQTKRKNLYQDVLLSTGICYQEDTLWKFMTPSKILLIFSYLIGVKDKSKEEDWLFDNLDIQGQLKNRNFQNLSGGNKRKICMAVCLMGSPKMKLLDQCSTGLDPVSRMSMVNTLKLQTSGTTVFTTHSIPQAEQICSRAIVMKKGQVSEDNKIFKLKQKYYPYYWAELILNSQQQNVQKIAEMIFKNINNNSYKTNVKKNRIEVRKQIIKLSQLMQRLQQAKKEQIIINFNINQPKLEDVYLLLTADEQDNNVNAQGQIQMREI